MTVLPVPLLALQERQCLCQGAEDGEERSGGFHGVHGQVREATVLGVKFEICIFKGLFKS